MSAELEESFMQASSVTDSNDDADISELMEESSVQVSSSVSECHEDGGKSAPNKVVVADEIQLQSMQLLLYDQSSKKYPCREKLPGWPKTVVPVNSVDTINCGDHILFQVTEPPFRAKFRSALVIQPSEYLEIIMNCEDGVVKTSIPFHLLNQTHKVVYESPLYDGITAIHRAEFRLSVEEKCYHVLNNNSHFFVTWCITGRECSLTDILNTLEIHSKCQEKQLKHVFYQSPIKTITDQSIQPWDHVKVGSQHFLVESVNKASGTFTAYTVGSDKKVALIQRVKISSGMVKIECNLYTECSNEQMRENIVQLEENEYQKCKWKRPDHFVTALKSGLELSLQESHCFTLEKDIVTKIVPVTMSLIVSKGDHLVIKDYRKPDYSYYSVLVYSCPDSTRVGIRPNIYSSEVIDLTLYPEVYRVDYSNSLPTDEVLLRGNSKEGEEILKKNNDQYVSWTKTGQVIPVKIPSDTSMKRSYKKITSFSQVKTGSHLLQHIEKTGEPVHQRHIVVTEQIGGSKFKVVSCHHGFVCEQVEELQGELYDVQYSSDQMLSDSETIKNVRKQIGQQKYSPWDRVLFIVQAKMKEYYEATATSISVFKDRVSYSTTDLEFEQRSCTSHSLPVSKSRIMCFAQVANGDYIIKVPNNVISKNSSVLHEHYLIESCGISTNHCTLIGTSKGKVVKLQCTIENYTVPENKHRFFYYRLNYEPDKCFLPEDSIKRATEMIGQRSRISRDKLIHFFKTGMQVQVCVRTLPDERDHIEQCQLQSSTLLGQPSYSLPVTSCDQLSKGTHVLYRQGNAFPPSYCSALIHKITNRDEADASLEVITNTSSNGITTRILNFSQLKSLSKVVYLSSRFSEEETIVRAKQIQEKSTDNFFHTEYYNSHHFVTMCRTGCEYSLGDIIARKQVLDHQFEKDGACVSDDLRLKPVLFKVPVKALSDIKIADHVMLGKQHYLVLSTDRERGTFSAYTAESFLNSKMKSVTLKQNQKWKSEGSQTVFKMKYSLDGSELCEQFQALDRAEEECRIGSKWNTSEGFVTKIKCDSEYFFDDRCIMSDDVNIKSYTTVNSSISLEKGDHLLLFDLEKSATKHKSVLVCRCIDQSTVEVIPPLELSLTNTSTKVKLEHESVDLTKYIVYRTNYSESLPPEDVLQRANSAIGRAILMKDGINPDGFASWAKTGRELSVSDSESEIKKNLQIADRRPLRYEKIMSPDDIKIGDHLFTKDKLDYFINDLSLPTTHFFVTERLKNTANPIFKVITLSLGTIKEVEKEFSPLAVRATWPVHRVIYPEEFSFDLAVKRARSLVGKKFSALAIFGSTMLRWIKTGSEEGLEINFLIDSSAPTSKSQIACFTQLNPGDYLIKQKSQSDSAITKALTFDNHYIVVSVESPHECTVIESWRRKVEKKPIVYNSCSANLSYYRINYDPGQCFPAEHSIEIAEKAFSNPSSFFSRYWKPNSEFARKGFIHFIKTGERLPNIEILQDDRFFLQRELVTSALNLHIGDHIERPLSLAPEHAQHHMLVMEPINHSTCKVIHYRVEKSFSRVVQFKKGDVVNEEVDIFICGDVFRIVYPERTDPRDGMDKLTQICEEGKRRLHGEVGKLEYHLKDNNCEHLVMLATIGIPLSIQVNQVIHHALVFARGSLRSFRGSIFHHGAECAPKEASSHLLGQACGQASKANQATSGVVNSGIKSATSVSALAMTGGIAFAINLAVETPVFVRSIYKLKKKAKFDVITEEEYKRGVIKESLVSACVVVGGTMGTIGGQATIPVPIVGAMVGGVFGSVLGQGSGYLAGELLGRLIKEKKLTLPKTISYKYKKLLEY